MENYLVDQNNLWAHNEKKLKETAFFLKLKGTFVYSKKKKKEDGMWGRYGRFHWDLSPKQIKLKG